MLNLQLFTSGGIRISNYPAKFWNRGRNIGERENDTFEDDLKPLNTNNQYLIMSSRFIWTKDLYRGINYRQSYRSRTTSVILTKFFFDLQLFLNFSRLRKITLTEFSFANAVLKKSVVFARVSFLNNFKFFFIQETVNVLLSVSSGIQLYICIKMQVLQNFGKTKQSVRIS